MAKLLVLDDEEAYLDSLQLVLSGEGYEVRTAANAEEALAVADSTDLQVLITDWRLKGNTTGLEVADSLRKINPRLQVIVLTGYSAEELAEQSQCNVVRVLEKPFYLNDLLAAVNEALESY